MVRSLDSRLGHIYSPFASCLQVGTRRQPLTTPCSSMSRRRTAAL